MNEQPIYHETLVIGYPSRSRMRGHRARRRLGRQLRQISRHFKSLFANKTEAEIKTITDRFHT